METLRHVLLIIHLLGFAAPVGGLLVQARVPEKVVNSAMRDGIGTAFLAGLLLVGVLEAGDDPVDHTKVAVKFAIGLVILVLVMANARKERIPTGLWGGLLLLAVVNTAVAVLWGKADATVVDVDAVVLLRGPAIVNTNDLVFTGTPTAPEITAAHTALAAVGVLTR